MSSAFAEPDADAILHDLIDSKGITPHQRISASAHLPRGRDRGTVEGCDGIHRRGTIVSSPCRSSSDRRHFAGGGPLSGCDLRGGGAPHFTPASSLGTQAWASRRLRGRANGGEGRQSGGPDLRGCGDTAPVRPRVLERQASSRCKNGRPGADASALPRQLPRSAHPPLPPPAKGSRPHLCPATPRPAVPRKPPDRLESTTRPLELHHVQCVKRGQVIMSLLGEVDAGEYRRRRLALLMEREMPCHSS